MEYLLTVIFCTAVGVCDIRTKVYATEDDCAASLRVQGGLKLIFPPKATRLVATCNPRKPV